MKRLSPPLLVVALALVLTACSAGSSATSAPTTVQATATTQAPATTKTTEPPATTVSERLAHWRDVVKSMDCAELATLEQRRLAVQFNDQAESLLAIHERQSKLGC